MTSTVPERFADAWRKSQWANKQIDDLEAAVLAYHRTNPYSSVKEIDPATGNRYWRAVVSSPIPPDIVLMTGDVVHNLRASLDYVIYTLADEQIRSGKRGALTEEERLRLGFPILRKPPNQPNQFERVIKKKAGPAGDEVAQYFSTLEIYKGGRDELIWMLDSLNNVDKHRLVLAVGSSVSRVASTTVFDKIFGPEAAARSGVAGLECITEIAQIIPVVDGEIFFLSTGVDMGDINFSYDIVLYEPEIMSPVALLPALKGMSYIPPFIMNALNVQAPPP